jgi:amino acid transporter
MLTATVIFIYFILAENSRIHYIVAVGCFWLFFCGAFLGLFSYLTKTKKSRDLTFDRTWNETKKLGWISLAGFFVSGICLFAGFIFFAQPGNIWRSSIILFTGAIFALIISMYGLIQRKITSQHYELSNQQQEIIELLTEMKSNEVKKISESLLA